MRFNTGRVRSLAGIARSRERDVGTALIVEAVDIDVLGQPAVAAKDGRKRHLNGGLPEIDAVGSHQDLGRIAAGDRELSGRRNSAIAGPNGHANTHVLSSSRLPDRQHGRAEAGGEPTRSALDRVLSGTAK